MLTPAIMFTVVTVGGAYATVDVLKRGDHCPPMRTLNCNDAPMPGRLVHNTAVEGAYETHVAE